MSDALTKACEYIASYDKCVKSEVCESREDYINYHCTGDCVRCWEEYFKKED